MNLIIKRNNSTYTLKDQDNDIELMVVSKHDLNQSYRIIDFRYTNVYTTPTEFLGDVAEIQVIAHHIYLKNKDMFNFPVKERERQNGSKQVLWRDMEGILLKGGDRVDKEFNFATESHVWSYEAAMRKLKDCQLFWKTYKGSYDDFEKLVENKRPSRSDFW